MASLLKDTQAQTTTAALNRGQVVTLVGLGILLWFLAALMLRALEPVGALTAPGVFLLYALIIPGTYPFVLLIRRLAKLRADQMMLGVTAVTATATLCDANALVWFPEALYGAKPLGAAAAVLWGVGVALFLGITMNRAR
jgi:hypothetical protein